RTVFYAGDGTDTDGKAPRHTPRGLPAFEIWTKRREQKKLFAQSLEHPALVGFDARLIEGVDAQQAAGDVAGKLEEVEQLAEVVGVQRGNVEDQAGQLLAVSGDGGGERRLVDVIEVLAVAVSKVF